MGFSRQEYWSGLPCPPPGDLPHPGIEPISLTSVALQVDSLPLSHWGRKASIAVVVVAVFELIKREIALSQRTGLIGHFKRGPMPCL